MAKFNPGASPNSKMLKDIQKKSNTTANAKATIDLDISLIDENPDNSSVFNLDEDELERLASVIKNEGFYGVIEVYKKNDGRYEISSGHRRVRACKKLGWKTIPAVVMDMPEENVARKKLIFSNIVNRTMTPMDWARSLAYHRETLKKEYGIDDVNVIRRKDVNLMQLLASDFGISERTAYRYLYLLDLIPELQEMVAKGEVPWRSVIALSSESEEIQRKCYQDVKEHLRMISNDDEGTRQISASSMEVFIRKYKNTQPVSVKSEKPAPEPALPTAPIIAEEEEETSATEEDYIDKISSSFEQEISSSELSQIHDRNEKTIDDALSVVATSIKNLSAGQLITRNREKTIQTIDEMIEFLESFKKKI